MQGRKPVSTDVRVLACRPGQHDDACGSLAVGCGGQIVGADDAVSDTERDQACNAAVDGAEVDGLGVHGLPISCPQRRQMRCLLKALA